MSGYQTVSGTHVPLRAPADTLARMTYAVGGTPEQLAEVGRDDAAAELRLLLDQEAHAPSAEPDDPQVRALLAYVETLPPDVQIEVARQLQGRVPPPEKDQRRRPTG